MRFFFFFFFFFFCFSLLKTTEFVLGLPKWQFFTGKKHFSPGKNQDFAPSEKYACYAPGRQAKPQDQMIFTQSSFYMQEMRCCNQVVVSVLCLPVWKDVKQRTINQSQGYSVNTGHWGLFWGQRDSWRCPSWSDRSLLYVVAPRVDPKAPPDAAR